MAHYGRYLFHFQNVTFNVTFPKVAFCRQEYPAFSPSLSATMAGHFGRAGGHPRACPCPAVPGSLWALVNLSRHWRACPCPAAPGQWSAAPSRTLPADRFPVHGFPVQGVLCRSVPVCNPSSIAPDQETLNPVFFLLTCIFWIGFFWIGKRSFF